jgi:hypothetical protein
VSYEGKIDLIENTSIYIKIRCIMNKSFKLSLVSGYIETYIYELLIRSSSSSYWSKVKYGICTYAHTHIITVTCLLKAGIAEPGELAIAKQRLCKHVLEAIYWGPKWNCSQW